MWSVHWYKNKNTLHCYPTKCHFLCFKYFPCFMTFLQISDYLEFSQGKVFPFIDGLMETSGFVNSTFFLLVGVQFLWHLPISVHCLIHYKVFLWCGVESVKWLPVLELYDHLFFRLCFGCSLDFIFLNKGIFRVFFQLPIFFLVVRLQSLWRLPNNFSFLFYTYVRNLRTRKRFQK